MSKRVNLICADFTHDEMKIIITSIDSLIKSREIFLSKLKSNIPEFLKKNSFIKNAINDMEKDSTYYRDIKLLKNRLEKLLIENTEVF